VTVAIVTDSAAALPADLAARHRITVVPMWLSIRGQSVREGERPLSELLGESALTAVHCSEAAIVKRYFSDGTYYWAYEWHPTWQGPSSPFCYAQNPTFWARSQYAAVYFPAA